MIGPYTKEIEVACRLAREAGEILLEVYAGEFEVVYKPGGGGPVTVADQRANDHIVAGLRAAFPGDGVVAEESEDTSDAQRFERCWFVDPLDGTREFVDGTGQFAVHIGLAERGEAVAGVVYEPLPDKLFRGIVGGSCELEVAGRSTVLRLGADAHEPLRMVASRAHPSAGLAWIQSVLGIETISQMGSVGIKCGVIASGEAELYVHASRKSYRWDACAPEAIVRAAGGFFGDMGGAFYRYDGPELQNLRGILACHPTALEEVLPIVRQLALESKILP